MVAGSVAGVLALVGTVRARVVPAGATSAGDCERAARRYETRCLMPRVEARLRLADDRDALAFVARMRDIDEACLDVTASGLAACTAWPRVRPTSEYRRWLRDVRETWQQREIEVDGARPACPPGVLHCL